MTPQASRTTTANSNAADSSLGEIAWRNTESGQSGHFAVKTAKCVIGSHANCDIQLPEPIAPQHVTLTFGKRFTLLKAPEMVQVGDRSVREWLIDEPTEINVGAWQITILPARCAKTLASVIPPHAVGSVLAPNTDSNSVPSSTTQSTSTPAPYMGDWTSEVSLSTRPPLVPTNFGTQADQQATLDSQRLEQVRRNLDKERQEYERLAQARFEQERLEQERLEQERLEQERLELERLEQEYLAIDQTEQSHFTAPTWGFAGFQPEQTEYAEDRIRSIELSIEQLRDGFESMRQSIAAGHQDHHNLASAFQDQLQNLSSQLAFDFQSQLTTQLEYRDNNWNNAFAKNLESIESHITTLGSRIENLSEQVANSDQSGDNRGPSELSSALFASLSGLEERLESIVNRMDEISVVTSDNANKLSDLGDNSQTSIRLVEETAQRLLSDRAELELSIEQIRSELQHVTHASQESYEFVLSQIQNFQLPLSHQDIGHNGEVINDEAYETPIHASEEVEDRLTQVLAVERTRLSEQYDPTQLHSLLEEADSQIRYEDSKRVEDRLQSFTENYAAGAHRTLSHNEQGSEYSESGTTYDDKYGTYGDSEGNYAESYTSESHSGSEQDSDAIAERIKRMLHHSDGANQASYQTDEPSSQNYSSQNRSSSTEPDVASVLSQYGFSSENSREESHYSEGRYEETSYEQSSYSDQPYAEQNSYGADTYGNAEAYSSDNSALSTDEHKSFVQAPYSSLPLEEHKAHEYYEDESREPEEPASIPLHQAKSHAPESLDSNDSDGDASIEAYMQQLLQRVKGGVEQTVATAPEPAKSVAPRSRADFLSGRRESQESRESRETPLTETESSTERRVLTQAEFTPRNHAPERQNDLNALRELANNTARRAITTSDSKRTNSALMFKLAIVAVALVVGIVILVIGKHGFTPATLGVIASFAVAAIWGYDCLINMRKLGRNRDIIRN